MIKVEKVSKTFPIGSNVFDDPKYFFSKAQNITALNDISLSIDKGEICAVLGSNGAGKTTLLKLLASALIPNKGKILINGQDINNIIGEKRFKTGFMPAGEIGFYGRLSLKGNLEFYASLNNIYPNEASKKIDCLFDFLNITNGSKRFQECSSGIKQRLNFARCIICDPDILYMDEPTRSLDPICAKEFRNYILTLNKDKKNTVVFATHNTKEAQELADKIVIMDSGKILLEGENVTNVSKLYSDTMNLK